MPTYSSEALITAALAAASGDELEPVTLATLAIAAAVAELAAAVTATGVMLADLTERMPPT